MGENDNDARDHRGNAGGRRDRRCRLLWQLFGILISRGLLLNTLIGQKNMVMIYFSVNGFGILNRIINEPVGGRRVERKDYAHRTGSESGR